MKDGNADEFPKQPYLLLVKSADAAISQIFIVIEYTAIPVRSVLKIFDLMCKLFYVFDLLYA